MNNKKKTAAARQAAEKARIREEVNRRLQDAAACPVPEVLQELNTTLRGLNEQAVARSRARYGANRVTREKRQPLVKRLAGAFINPFTAVLCCLALVSIMTDMVFPLCSLFGGSDSIRDYIAFPKNNAGRDVMLDAPGCIDQAQLDELCLSLVKPAEK